MIRTLAVIISAGLGAAVVGLSAQTVPPYEIVFTQKDPAAYDNPISVVLARADGSSPTLVSSEKATQITPSAWSPNGQHIVFRTIRSTDYDLTDACGGYSHRPMYAFSIDPKTQEFTKPTRLTDLLTVDEPVWSPDSSMLLFASSCEDPKKVKGKESTLYAVYVLDLKTRERRRLTEFGPYGKPWWSPDGKKIAYDGREPGSAEMGIFVADADGRNAKRIADGIRPRWAPKGDRIAYVRGSALLVVDTDGNNKRQLEVLPSAQDYVWSPDASKMFVSSQLAMVIDMTTYTKTYIEPPGTDHVFSADGKTIVLTRYNPAEIQALAFLDKPAKTMTLLKFPAGMRPDLTGLAFRPRQ